MMEHTPDVKALLASLKECSDELSDMIKYHYSATIHHPSMKRKYDLDMEPVNRARDLLKIFVVKE